MASSGKPVHIDEVVKIETEINDHKENLALDSNITGASVGLTSMKNKRMSWFVILLTLLKKKGLSNGRLS